MSTRVVQVLHVEDDVMQQRLIGKMLESMAGRQFVVTTAVSEDEALARFRQGGVELVILDYHLEQGDGLSCVKRLRELDPIVPILALSGVATPEIAANLLEAGADDYLSKQDLETAALVASVQQALARADAWRKHAPAASGDPADALLGQLRKDFAAVVGPWFLARLDEYEKAVGQGNVDLRRLQSQFETLCAELDRNQSPDRPPARRLLRPLLLEVLLRLCGEDGKNE